MKTSNKNYKILVLSDLKEPITNVLKSTISLAKMIDADIQFFHVKRAAEIVETDNQLSAMRKINREYITTDKKIRKEVFSFSSNFDVSINYAFSFGNVKEEKEQNSNESTSADVSGSDKIDSNENIKKNIKNTSPMENPPKKKPKRYTSFM